MRILADLRVEILTGANHLRVGSCLLLTANCTLPTS